MRPRLAAYGHSWVAGAGASRPDRCLVDTAALLLEMTPINRGVGGTSSAQTAELIRRDGAAPADAYLIMTGLNDARLHGLNPAALDAYTRALKAVVDTCGAQTTRAPVLLVEQPPLDDYSKHEPHNRGSTAAVAAYNQRMHKVAARHWQTALVKVTDWDAWSMLASDTVHPNDLGHATIGAAVARTHQAASIGRPSRLHD